MGGADGGNAIFGSEDSGDFDLDFVEGDLDIAFDGVRLGKERSVSQRVDEFLGLGGVGFQVLGTQGPQIFDLDVEAGDLFRGNFVITSD